MLYKLLTFSNIYDRLMYMFQKGKLSYYLYFVIFLVTKNVYTVKPVLSNTCLINFTDLSDDDFHFQVIFSVFFALCNLTPCRFGHKIPLPVHVVLDRFCCSMKLEAYLEQIARLQSVQTDLFMNHQNIADLCKWKLPRQ